MNKPRIVKDYDTLSEAVKEQIKLVYPKGFTQHLISFYNKDGEKKMGLPFETEEVYYLVRMTLVKAEAIIEDDDDYNDDGILRTSVKEKYENKYDDLDYLNINSNEDNDFTNPDDDDEDDDWD